MNKSFWNFYADESPKPFYILLGLFVLNNMILAVNFLEPTAGRIASVRHICNSVLLIMCVMYLAFNLLIWKIKAYTCIITMILLVVTGFGWNIIGSSFEAFNTTIAVLLALLAYKRDYSVVLKVFLFCHAAVMLIGLIGLGVGFAANSYKLDSTDFGLSLGLVYPNHAGRILFIIFIICWYLWGRNKYLLSTLMAWTISAFMWFFIKCKTTALLLIAFPVCWVVISYFINKENNKEIEASSVIDKKSSLYECILRSIKVFFLGCVIFTPFVCFVLTYLLGKLRFFFMDHWHYGQSIFSLLMRFISAGILFRTYGFPLLGRPLDERDAIAEVNNGRIYVAVIVDNAYITYLIAIGGLALIAVMLWLCFSNYRAYKAHDHAILLINVFLCGYGLLETAYFQFEYNFLFFYPLTLGAFIFGNEMFFGKKRVVPDENAETLTEERSDSLSHEESVQQVTPAVQEPSDVNKLDSAANV